MYIQEFDGDAPIPDQKYWSTKFDSYEKARDAAVEIYDSKCTEMSRDDWYDYHIIITEDYEGESLVAIVHCGRVYVGNAAKIMYEAFE